MTLTKTPLTFIKSHSESSIFLRLYFSGNCHHSRDSDWAILNEEDGAAKTVSTLLTLTKFKGFTDVSVSIG